MRTATRYETAVRMPVQKNSAPAVASDSANRWYSHSASIDLHDEAAAECVEAEQRGERVHRALRFTAAARSPACGGFGGARGKPR